MPQFKVEVSDSRAFATNFDPSPIRSRSTILTALFCWSSGTYLLFKMHSEDMSLIKDRPFDVWNSFLVLAIAFLGVRLLCVGLRQLFPSGESLECTKETLTISRIRDYVFTGKWQSESFPIDMVKDMSFATLRMSRYGGTNGLAFLVNGKKKKVLYGLESPEASEILQGMSKLGVNIIHDPGMPIMVEMALERRKSRFGLWG